MIPESQASLDACGILFPSVTTKSVSRHYQRNVSQEAKMSGLKIILKVQFMFIIKINCLQTFLELFCSVHLVIEGCHPVSKVSVLEIS